MHADDHLEDKVKAAMIFNFVKFVGWDESRFEDENSAIVISVVDDLRLARMLERAVDGKTVRGRRFEIVPLRSSEIGSLDHSHVVVTGELQRERLSQVIERVPKTGVLTIGESEDFATDGCGIIRLYKEDTKIRFEVNLERAKRSALKMSGNLLRLARIVSGGDCDDRDR